MLPAPASPSSSPQEPDHGQAPTDVAIGDFDKHGRMIPYRPGRSCPQWRAPVALSAVPQTSGIVKGFRMPASHCARYCTEAGVRKASKEETAGRVCAGGSVGLWGFNARFCATWPLSDGTAG